MANNKNVVTVYVEGGCVTDVEGLPDGWEYTIIDLDDRDTLSRKECIESNFHLTQVDSDGYCNYCGYQE